MARDVAAAFSPCRTQLDARAVAYRVGLVVLATDHTTERDFARLMDPAQIGVYASRIDYENPTTPENLRLTGPRLTAAAGQILPEEELDVLVYSCTAASVVLGNEVVAGHLRAAKPGAACVTPSSAAFDAFAALGTGRVSVLTPYSTGVTDALVRYFGEHGLDVVSAQCFGLEDDREMARLSQDCIIEAAVAAMSPQAEALFLSCTALRSAECAARIEAATGRPVITSNQAMIWRSFRHLGLEPGIAGAGRIFDH